jgi:glutamine---fructose-6-phosphate transaminase (isomerizing)
VESTFSQDKEFPVTEKGRIIRGRYLEDILAQPDALRSTLEATTIPTGLLQIRKGLEEGRFKRIVLTGMGSSFYGLTPLYLALVNHGYEVAQVETSELIHYLPGLLNPQSLVIAVSQSGRSAETLRLLDLNARRATLLAVTNTSDSPLAAAADSILLTHAGDEFSVSSKTYVCTLAVLEQLAGFLCHEPEDKVQDELLASVTTMADYLKGWQQHLHELAPLLEGIQHLFFVGRGASLAAAQTGALITKESTGAHAEAMSSAAFRHGPMEILAQNTFVAVFEGAPITRALNDNLLRDINTSPARGVLVGPHAELPSLRIPSPSARVAPILEILPIEIMTLAMAYLSSVEAGVFQRGAKVTVTE